ncbi:CDP-glycerol glycerophosphotransferase family protein, partial [Citrobacter sp. Awk 4]|uniref:CDP-glycerol glycerophosphotransferase family protein n=1 Tax=Citrobacter sp. Awk 4 TaxID=2963955 RepID=UPI003FA498B1
MNKKLKRIIKGAISILNGFLPKNRKRIIFKSVPDYAGNCKALSEYIRHNHKDYQVVWVYT